MRLVDVGGLGPVHRGAPTGPSRSGILVAAAVLQWDCSVLEVLSEGGSLGGVSFCLSFGSLFFFSLGFFCR